MGIAIIAKHIWMTDQLRGGKLIKAGIIEKKKYIHPKISQFLTLY